MLSIYLSMKRTLFLYLMCAFGFSCQLQAQHIKRSLGISDINVSVLTQQQGIGGQVSYERLFGENNNRSFQAGIKYLNAKADLAQTDQKATLNDFTLNLGVRRYFTVKGFYPYLGAGAFIGYETVSDKGLKESIRLERKNTALYGVQAHGGTEYFLPFGSLFVEATPQYEFKLKEFHLAFNLGLKLFL